MFFYDTCSLLKELDKVFLTNFAISNISLIELENIKTSTTKDEETKYRARKVLHLLEKYEDKFTLIIFKDNFLTRKFKDYEVNNDLKIISCAVYLNKTTPITFITADLACKHIANCFLTTRYIVDEIVEDYSGYTIVKCDTEDKMNNFYTSLNEEKNYYTNEYIFVENQDKEIIDKYIYKDKHLTQLVYPCFTSKQFGKIKPKDAYQWAAMDSMMRNKLTLLRGPAGSGKSYLALGYLFDQLEKGKIDKIIIFCNPVATKDACKFGFLPGTAEEKILGSQIGSFLVSKIGARDQVERLIENEQLILLPVADCRGYDTTGMRAGIYMTEAQNTTIDMMKLMLQRIGADSVCIIEGDDRAQVDMSAYSGANNGIRRLSEVFRGDDNYGEITLQKCYRSHIAELAEKM